MVKRPADIFPPPQELLELEPEDLAPLLLQYLSQGDGRNLSLYNVTRPGSDIGQYAGAQHDQVVRAVTEAWMVLEREGLLAPEPASPHGDWRFMTRRGRSLQSQTDFQAYVRGNLLPAKSLDPTLATKVRPLFLRGDYDTAVFRAFKEVEIRVSSAAGLPQNLIGVDLMRAAFHPQTGPLTDIARPVPEREAAGHLFAGAIGLFKNPSSHRDIQYSPEEAGNLISFANYLILWVGRLRSQRP